MMKRTLIPALLAIALAMAPLHAAELWLEASPTAPQTKTPITVRLLLGDLFVGEERALDPEKVTSFQRLSKNGRRNLPREEGTLPVAEYKAGGDGVEIVALVWLGRAGGYYCKTIQVVGDAKPGHPLRFSQLGHRLEIVPQTDPVQLLRNGGEFEVQVLYEQEPLAGIRLLAIPKDGAAEFAVSRITDEIGIARFELNRAGPWMITVAYKQDGARSRATLTLSAGAP